MFKPQMTEADVLAMVAQSNEFEQLKVQNAKHHDANRVPEFAVSVR